ncbi:hypothetical protein BOTBODRAFT_144417 [Botryobasidium botryosum FD-172 SS1]|uniref:Zn(2)-C6 fungal-type domain-containing protein n=1 Tax=Botryobasidium botryosum (strain FD-172 SS1) TaxID=930990 RepID=A0A067MLH7_BOTB1|nr:hypothetical protein BOTBODRAFT_144417 [Botryobasidium botryosum FD-172 SS1]
MSASGSDTTMVLVRGNACDMCRKRKRRCDAGKPACTPCIKSQLSAQCTYAGPEARRRSAVSLRELEEAADKLESRISQLASEMSAGKQSDLQEPRVVARATIRPPPRAIPRILHRTVVPLPMKDPSQDSWTRHHDVPAQIREPLIQAFCKFRWQFGIQWNIPRLLASLNLSTTHPDAPHPAFLNAVLLHGAFFCDTGLKRYEDLFYRRMSRELALSLEKGDRLFDFIRASTLAGCYFYCAARLPEAHTRISSTLRFAVACGFHAISSPSLDTGFHLIPPCADAIELGDRINTFWILFNADQMGSLLLASPSTISDDEITTILPHRLSAYENGDYILQPVDTLSSMYDPFVAPAPAKMDHHGTLFPKSLALLYRVCVLVARAKGVTVIDSALRQEVFATALAAIKLADSLPPICDQETEFEDSAATLPAFAPVYLAAHAAAIQIMDILPDEDPKYHSRQVEAARSAMTIVKELRTVPHGYMPLLLGLTVTPVHAFLVREEMRYKKSGDTENATAMQNDIKTLVETLSRVAEMFPEAGAGQIEIVGRNASDLKSIEL